MALTPVKDISASVCRDIEVIFSDIDDTLTLDGMLPAIAYEAMWRAHDDGIKVIPVTGRPAGWCDHLARMWPVAAVVGENGALCFSMVNGTMRRIYSPRPADAAQRLDRIQQDVLDQVAGCKVSADQAYREYDLAIDFAEEVPRLDEASIDEIVRIAKEHGATVKVSSIHINIWYGEFDKRSMCLRAFSELFGEELDRQRVTFVGDSPNDEPMFEYFPHAVGVANVKTLTHRMKTLPAYVTEERGGYGFAEFVDILLAKRGE